MTDCPSCGWSAVIEKTEGQTLRQKCLECGWSQGMKLSLSCEDDELFGSVAGYPSNPPKESELPLNVNKWYSRPIMLGKAERARKDSPD